MTTFVHWFCAWYFGLSGSGLAILWVLLMCFILAVAAFAIHWTDPLTSDKRVAARKAKMQKRERRRLRQFIANAEIAKHRYECSPETSRGFIFAMRDMK